MPHKQNNPTLRRILIIVAAILGIALIIYLSIQGRRYFTRRSLRQMQGMLNTYGAWSPIAIFLLMLLSTIIPPLPLPIPLLEMVAGYMYGFGPGFCLIWFSQIISSLAAYGLAKYFGKKILKNILKYPIVGVYQRYINEKGPVAVFITRATLSSPFGMMSFLPALSKMGVIPYIVATALGTIPESTLFPFIGSMIRTVRLRLWYVFILVVVLGTIGPVLTYVVTKYIRRETK
jgi:uncharacterized membrane protein YdjX (TVP38/TMEM64 family)